MVTSVARHFCSVFRKSVLRPGRCLSTNGNRHPTVYFSGIQPTGVPHLGNYFGFIEQWLNIQKNEPSSSALYLSVVDYHAMSSGLVPSDQLQQNIINMAAGLLACGVDPRRTVLFQQSAVQEHTDLMFILGVLQTVAQLKRLPQYKEKSSKFKQGNSPLNLLIYPVLQAADVLLYKGTHVPVGEDQSQHLCLLRDLATHFNSAFHVNLFPIPEQVSSVHRRIKSLRDPAKKMSKSDPSTWSRIDLNDSRDILFEKCSKALSDFEANITYEPERRPAVSNLVSLYCAVTGQNPEVVVNESVGLDTREFKAKLAGKLDEKFAPVRVKYEELLRNRSEVVGILDEGAEKARDIAKRNMKEIRDVIGLNL